MKNELIEEYRRYLIDSEKSKATTEKYIRDITAFFTFLNGRELCREAVMEYKKNISEKYLPTSANSMLIAINGFFKYFNLDNYCVKLLKIQKQIFEAEERELTREEYSRLVEASKGTRLSYIIQTLCATGIRISELKFITVEAVMAGKTTVNSKGKRRIIFIPAKLQKILKIYIKNTKLRSGPVFTSKNGNPLNRSNVWRDMKTLCVNAQVNPKKVFPHNLRHLFARTFYSVEKDIVRLADILGHSSINTTRIYTVETESHLIRRLEKIQKLLIT